MFLSYPLLSQHRDEAGKRTIETGEIRVGKAMVDKLAERRCIFSKLCINDLSSSFTSSLTPSSWLLHALLIYFKKPTEEGEKRDK